MWAGLPVEYIFSGCTDPARMFKAATYEEILEYHIYDAEYKLNVRARACMQARVRARGLPVGVVCSTRAHTHRPSLAIAAGLGR